MRSYGMFERACWLRSPAPTVRPAAPTHAIIYPMLDGNDRAAKAMHEDLSGHAEKLKARINKKTKRFGIAMGLKVSDPSGFHTRIAGDIDTLYVLAHGSGYEFGSAKVGVLDMLPEDVVDWLIASGLLKKGLKVKIAACYSGTKWSATHEPFAQAVARYLKEKGWGDKGLIVRGYNGEVGEKLVAGKLLTICDTVWTDTEKLAVKKLMEGSSRSRATVVPVRASASKRDFTV